MPEAVGCRHVCWSVRVVLQTNLVRCYLCVDGVIARWGPERLKHNTEALIKREAHLSIFVKSDEENTNSVSSWILYNQRGLS